MAQHINKTEIDERFLTAVNSVIIDRHFTKTRMAESLGLKLTTFSMMLGSRMHVGADTIANLCATHNVSAEWILTGRGPMWKTLARNRRQKASEKPTFQPDSAQSSDEICWVFMKILKEKDTCIIEKTEEIGRLKAIIEELERNIKSQTV